MPDKIAFLFPGQGSQYVGMGRDLSNAIPGAKEIFDLADTVCDRPISRLCFEGPMEELTLTVHLQPAITAVSLACLTALSDSAVRPVFSAGHSLGEYAALASAGVISPDDALRLVSKRGELMHREAQKNPGAMAAVMGLDIHTVDGIVHQAAEKGILGIANHNTAEQIVVTGQEEPLARAAELVKERGGKAIPLKVSGAWHSPLMREAVEDFRRFMNKIPFSRPVSSVLFNATSEEETDPERIRDIMARQLVSPVRWYDIILRMLEEEVDVFVEVGPKKVLSGLLKKILPSDQSVKIYNLEDANGLRLLLDDLG
ncbi:MAG: ACP S-malonyltransferase [Deltaproteobacteria bacterium]|nr:ACP S-malonyltransferase [Deltaproteobacteria bacterium]